ncbi:LutC/YkgG family protein [Thalassolituus sp. LLYu03]|uniref:LutC/YkgG family protein n=1 Tax=Thalassolituus sp. LLYu03 TaxID=3421656 RepID=UPI003D2E1254
MSSRDRILQRLRTSVSTQATAAARDPMSVDSGWPVLPREQWLASFRQNLTDNHADVIEVSSAQWQDVVLDQFRARGVRTLRAGSHAEGQALVAAANNAGFVAETAIESVEKSALFNDTDAGFSVALAGLAETGTLVVNTGPQEPRTLSLVPPLNVILLRASALYASFSQWVAQGGLPERMPTNVLLISGPSKTADIQQTLAYGAHGPKELIVMVLTDA